MSEAAPSQQPAPEAVPTPTPEATPQDWRASLPEAAQGWSEVQQAKDINGLMDYYGHMRTRMGRSISIPPENATQEEWQSFNAKLMDKVPDLVRKPNLEDDASFQDFYKSLGMPEDRDGYALPEDVQIDISNDIDWLRDMAHESGLSNKQFQTLVNGMVQNHIKNIDSQEADLNASQSALRNEWGFAFDERNQAVKNFAEMTGAPEQLMEAINTGKLSGDVVKWMHGVVKQVSGEGKPLPDMHNAQPALDPYEMEAKANDMYQRMMNLPTHSPEYQRLMEQRVQLMGSISKAKNR